MDPHFSEYLAAVAGMTDLYGEAGDDRPTEFHEDGACQMSDALRREEAAITPASGRPATLAAVELAPSWTI